MGIEEKIADIEKEISRTQKNKATEAHLGLLRSRLSKLRQELGVPKSKSVGKTSAKSNSKSTKKPNIAVKDKPTKSKKQNTSSTESSEEELDESSSESDGQLSTGATFNKFAALKLDAEDEESSEKEEINQEIQLQAASMKPKKRKKKNIEKVLTSQEPSFDKLTEEELLEFFGSQNRETSTQVNATSLKTYKSGLNPKFLNYRYEFQKTLGKNAAGLLEEGSSSGTRSKPGIVRGVHHLFVTPGQNSMDAKEFIDRYIRVEPDPSKPSYLVFRRTRRYKELQHNFLLMVYTNQDQIIPEVLHQMPFHTDALLLMSNIYERDENIATARQTVETALNGLQQCFDHQQRNNPQSHRMSYKYPANRSYFVLLFKHMNLIASRFPKTALEIGKYLFNLSPLDDPLAMILVLDHLALKAKDYIYLVAFYRTLKDPKNLDMLPNFCYSYALALFHLASTGHCQADMNEAKKALTDAILHFPVVLTLLNEKLEIPMGRDLSSSYLIRDSQREDNPGLDLLQALYVRRSHFLWKDPEVLSWMISTASAIFPSLGMPELKLEIQRLTDCRKRSYNGTPSNIWRHVILLNIPDSERVFQLRLANDSQNFIFPFDPIPPSNSEDKDEFDLHTAFKANQLPHLAEPEAPVTQPATIGNMIHEIINATGEFFHLFLPSTAIPVPGAEDANSAIFNGEVIMGAPTQDDSPMSDELLSYMDQITILQDEWASERQ